MLKFKIKVEEPDAPNVFEKFVNASKFPTSLPISELDMLSLIRIARGRNRNLYARLIEWYRKIDGKFRLVA
jgi:hypothetical protein